jgi:hypothetical protein
LLQAREKIKVGLAEAEAELLRKIIRFSGRGLGEEDRGLFCGADGYFFEVHPEPTAALSDGPNMLYLKDFEGVLRRLVGGDATT